MIDIHCHIIPGIDDGAKDIEDAIKMARIAYKDGITNIVATPHLMEEGIYRDNNQISAKVDGLNRLIEDEGIDVKIMMGNEVYITPNLPTLVELGQANTINNTQYLLIEFPMFDIPNYTEDVIYRLKLMGITPIIAHPERYREVIENPNRLIGFIEQGALLQANSGSVMGRFGEKIGETVETLISHNMIHLVASDGHSSRSRTPRLKKAYEKVKAIHGKDKANKLFYDHPKRVINNEAIIVDQPIALNQRKSKINSIFQMFKLPVRNIR